MPSARTVSKLRPNDCAMFIDIIMESAACWPGLAVAIWLATATPTITAAPMIVT